jgi:tetratricopeptide (TPR) repeat protein
MKLFLSYAREDDEPFVAELHERLTDAGFDVWYDRVSLPSRGLTFLQEIRDAIDAVDKIVVALGPDAVSSDYVRAEWQYALAVRKVVVPVLRKGTHDLLPAELMNLHCEDCVDKEIGSVLDYLVELIRAPVPPLGRTSGVPLLPPCFQPRPDDLTRLSDAVLLDLKQPVERAESERVTVLNGMGGIGKSVLACSFVQSTETLRAFQEGVYWIKPLPDADESKLLGQFARLLGIPISPGADREEVLRILAGHLRKKRCLFVLDNATDGAHVKTLRQVLGARCRLIVTTRDGRMASSLGAIEVKLGELSPEQTLRHLADWVNCQAEDLPPEAREVAEQCAGHPYSTAICGALARDGNPWPVLKKALEESQLESLAKEDLHDDYINVFQCLDLSVNLLASEEVDRLGELVVFPAEIEIPEAAVTLLWGRREGVSELDLNLGLTSLERRALVRLREDGGHRFVSLHALMLDYIRARFRRSGPELASLHGELLDAYSALCSDGWATGPDDGYYFGFLAYHLNAAGRFRDLQELIDKPWMDARSRREGSHRGFIEDVDQAIDAARAAEPQAVVRCLRGHLLHATLGSLASNLPASILGALARVELGRGEPAPRALGHARLITRPHQRVAALTLVAEALTDGGMTSKASEILEEAFSIADQIEDGSEAWASFARLQAMVGAMDSALTRSRDAAWHREREGLLLEGVAIGFGRAGDLVRSVAIVRSIENPAVSARALCTLAEKCPSIDDLLENWTEDLVSPEVRPIVLASIVHRVCESGDYERASSIVSRIEDPLFRYLTVLEATKRLPLPEAEETVRGTAEGSFARIDGSEPEVRVLVLPAVAKLFAALDDRSRASEVVRQALESAQELSGSPERTNAVCGLLITLHEVGGDCDQIRQTLRATYAEARDVSDLTQRLQAMLVVAVAAVTVADFAVATEIGEAIQTAAEPPKPEGDAGAGNLAGILKMFTRIGDSQIEDTRIGCLQALSASLAAAGRSDEAFEVAGRIATESLRADAVAGVISGLAAAGEFDRALGAADQLEHISERNSALGDIALQLSNAGELAWALDIAERVLARSESLREDDLHDRDEFADRISHRLLDAGLVEEACTVAEGLQYPWFRIIGLCRAGHAVKKTGGVDRAEAMFDSALAAASAESFHQRQLVERLVEAGEIERAAAVERNFDGNAGDLREIRKHLATGYTAVLQRDLARATWMRLAQMLQEDANNRDGGLPDVAGGLAHAGFREEALEVVRTIESTWNKTRALIGVMEGLHRNGGVDAALRVAGEAQELAQSDESVLNQVGLLGRLVETLWDLGEESKAREVVEDASRIVATVHARDRSSVSSSLAQALVKVGELDAALDAASDVRKTSDDWRKIHDQVCINLLAAGRQDRAVDVARSMLRTCTSESDAPDRESALPIAYVFGRAGNVPAVNEVVEAVSEEDDQQRVLVQAIGGLITARHLETALELSPKVIDDGSRAHLQSGIANAMFSQDADRALDLLHTALVTARRRGRRTVFGVLGNALSIVSGIDGGRALAELHGALVEIESWWSSPTEVAADAANQASPS